MRLSAVVSATLIRFNMSAILRSSLNRFKCFQKSLGSIRIVSPSQILREIVFSRYKELLVKRILNSFNNIYKLFYVIIHIQDHLPHEIHPVLIPMIITIGLPLNNWLQLSPQQFPHCVAQSRNFRIFQTLRFYVKTLLKFL